ncbi:MAG: GDSL-type esterase/lipase family protein [Desulfovibrionaceae bacterium]|nr:GDSL-type esterase/lipase family protein [Desulfovibrionaceae bacterium]
MRAFPRPSRITILALCLAVAVAVILAIGCMRGLDAPARTSDQATEVPAPIASGDRSAASAPVGHESPVAAAIPEADTTPGTASPQPSPLAASTFSHMVEPLTARLFIVAQDVAPNAPTETGPPAAARSAPPSDRPEPASAQAAVAETAANPALPAAAPQPAAPAAPASIAEPAPDTSDAPVELAAMSQPRPHGPAKPDLKPEPAPENVAKSQPRTVLVVGDSFAVGIGMTMAESLRGAKDIRLDQKGKTSSGLDNVKFHNWGKTLEGLLAATRPDALVVMIGGNDAQNGPGTEAWADSYRQKAGGFLAIAAQKNVPVYWVSLPPMREAGLNARVKTTNAAMRAACESGPNCRFIDAWDLFSDDKGEFAAEKNLGGKNVKLRGKDGVHFTMAGYRLLSDRILEGFVPTMEISQKK